MQFIQDVLRLHRLVTPV